MVMSRGRVIPRSSKRMKEGSGRNGRQHWTRRRWVISINHPPSPCPMLPPIPSTPRKEVAGIWVISKQQVQEEDWVTAGVLGEGETLSCG
jgi:hypothetical protein